MVEKRSDGPSTGLVIDTNINLSEPYAALVLDLDELLETGRAKIRKLSSDAFRDPANLEGDEEAQKKYERLREKTLKFGSHISWRKKDVDSTTEFIGKFENINPLLETRVLHGIGQILLDGAINPAKQDKIYTKYFGNVVIPSFLIHKASPNVFFEAWISCRFNKETSIFEHQLHSYNKICSYSKQTDIIHLPWNQGYSVEFLCSLAGDSDDEFEGITFKDGGRSDSKSEKKTAFCTGDGIFLLENSPMTKCIFPIKHDRTIIFGALYEVECFWNRVEECYIVLDLLKVYEKDLWMPVYKPNSSLYAEVHAHPTFRGIYESKIFGLLDDPFGSLAFFHLGQFANTHIPVTVLDRNPSRHGQIRFNITSLARRDMDSSSILGLNNEIRVVDVDGVVVEGGVVSAEHSPIVFHFRADETSLPSPGTQVTFEALYDKRMDVFNITEWHLNKTRSKLPVGRETFSYAGSVSEEQTVYKATVRLVTIKGDAEMLYCEEFGLIDDCLNRVVLQENINNYDVWIKATIAQEGYEYPARTPYHIVAVDDEILAQEEPSNQETPILGAVQKAKFMECPICLNQYELNDQLVSSAHSLERRQNLIQDLQDQVVTVNADLAREMAKADDLGSLQQENAALKRMLDEVSDKLSRCEGSVNHYKSKVDQIERENTCLKNKILQLENEQEGFLRREAEQERREKERNDWDLMEDYENVPQPENVVMVLPARQLMRDETKKQLTDLGIVLIHRADLTSRQLLATSKKQYHETVVPMVNTLVKKAAEMIV